MKITKEMLTIVTDAMIAIMNEKGAMTRMCKAEEIESLLLKADVKEFTPVMMCLRGLIDVKYVRYFKKDSGQLVYGFTKKALEKIKEQSAPIEDDADIEENDMDFLPVHA